MKSDASAPRALGYRNETVFRSAERLLASQPVSAGRRWPGRWLIFLLGVACGLSVAVWWNFGREGQRTSPVIRKSEPPRDASGPGTGNQPIAARRAAPSSETKEASTVEVPQRGPTQPAATSAQAATAPASAGAAAQTAAAEKPKTLEIAGVVFAAADSPVLRLVGDLRSSGGTQVRRVEFWIYFLWDFTVVRAEMKLPDTPAWPMVNLEGTCDLKSIHVREQFDPAGYDITIRFPVTVDDKFEGEWKDPHLRIGAAGTVALDMAPRYRGRPR